MSVWSLLTQYLHGDSILFAGVIFYLFRFYTKREDEYTARLISLHDRYHDQAVDLAKTLAVLAERMED